MSAEQITLANGLNVWAPNAFEAQTLYREIFVEGQHIKIDADLPAGAVIFDVGANIGLFSIAAAQRCPSARIYAFEPIAEVFALLSRNLAEHAPNAIVRNVGLGATTMQARFTFDRFSTFTASSCPEVFDTGISPSAYAAAALDAAHRVTPNAMTRTLLAGLERKATRPFVIAFMVPVLAALALRKRLFLKQCECAIQRFSEALQASGEATVDLVKIDVEGAEEAVLSGIRDEDWPRLRQLAIEVHDVDGRLDRMTAKLRGLGYTVRVETSDWPLLRMMRISTIYARAASSAAR